VTARAMAERNIEVFRAAGVDAVVTGCASCGLTLKREYEEMLGIAGGLGIPVFDFTEFLALRGFVPPRSEERKKIRVTFHDPCHLVRGQGISAEPRSILRSLPWVEFVEMRDADRCCGSGGTFSLTHYDLSKAIARRKVEAIRDAHVDVVATECQSCVMQLRDMLAQAGVDVPVVSVAEVASLRGAAER
jgi:glycolate oxidase iron-sulfur subunit